MLKYITILKDGGDGWILIDIPDLNCMTQARDIVDVIPTAKDYMELMLSEYYLHGEAYPKASDIEDIEYDKEKEIPFIISIDEKKAVELAEKGQDNRK